MKTIGSLFRTSALVRCLLIASCLAGLTWNTVAATRSAGITDSGNAVPLEGGLLRLGAANNLAANEDFLRCVVSDSTKGYAWFGATTSPGQVIKVAFDGINNAPRRVASLILEPGEDSIFTGVIDTNTGYAYFGTDTSPGRVVKVSLGTSNTPPVRIGAVTLGFGENNLYVSVIDPAAGYAYFATRTLPVRVVKISLGAGTNAPVRVGVNSLSSGDGLVRSAVIDPTAGYAWFGTFSDPGHVVKVALGAGNLPPTRVDSLTLDVGENRLTSAVIDRAAGVAWFGTYSSPGKVVKVALGNGNAAPSRIGAVTLDASEGFLACASMSGGSPGNVFFGCDAIPAKVVKVSLGARTNAPTRVDAVTLPSGEESLVSAGDVGAALFFGSLTQAGQVIQVGAGASGQPPVRQSALTLGRGENDLQSVVIDAANGYAWFGTATFPGQVVKVKLGKAGQPPQRIAAVSLEPGEDRPVCAVGDVAGGYAWFGTGGGASRVVKVALGSGDSPPTRVGAVTLNGDERALRSAVIDLTNRYAYFGTAVNPPGKVIKVALGESNNPPTRVGAVSLATNEWDFQSAVIDAAGTYALFGTGQYLADAHEGGKVVKIALGYRTNAPTRVGVLALPAGEEALHSAVSDPLTGYAWFGAGLSEGRAIKVAFESGNTPPRRVGAAPFNTNEAPVGAGAFIDAPAGYALFSGGGFPSRVIKVALGDGEATPARVGSIELPPNENSLHCAAGDPMSGLAWFGTSTQPGNVVLISYSQKGFIKGTRFVLTESGALNNVNFYSHRATGRLRLALYARNGINRNLLWQSGVITNTVANGWITVPVSQGTPTSVPLTAGTNDLCWQVDTTADVPSYVGGVAGDGFRQPADFGAFPAALTEGTNSFEATSETWASYITYDIPDIPQPVITSIVRSNDTLTLVWISNPGTLYQVQHCTNLPPPTWTDDGPPVQAAGTTTQWSTNGVSGSTRFYRLKLP